MLMSSWDSAFRAGNDWFPLDKYGKFDLDPVSYIDTWKAMEALLATKKVKAIGISNFNDRRINDLLSKCTVVPAVNQIEAHPYLQQPSLFKLCKEKGILIEAYSPLGNNQTGEPRTVDDPKVHELAKRLGKDQGQLLVSWGVQKGHVVLPKSVTNSRIESNFQGTFSHFLYPFLNYTDSWINIDFIIPEAEFEELNALERHKRFNFPAHWGYDIFDEAGLEGVKGAALDWAEANKQKA